MALLKVKAHARGLMAASTKDPGSEGSATGSALFSSPMEVPTRVCGWMTLCMAKGLWLRTQQRSRQLGNMADCTDAAISSMQTRLILLRGTMAHSFMISAKEPAET